MWSGKFTSVLIYTKLHPKVCRYLLVLLMTYMKNAPHKVKTYEILTARALVVIFTRVTTLHPCYMKSAIVLSQIDARNFYSDI